MGRSFILVYLTFLKFCANGIEMNDAFDFLLRKFKSKRKELLSGLKISLFNCHFDLAMTLCSLIQKNGPPPEEKFLLECIHGIGERMSQLNKDKYNDILYYLFVYYYEDNSKNKKTSNINMDDDIGWNIKCAKALYQSWKGQIYPTLYWMCKTKRLFKSRKETHELAVISGMHSDETTMNYVLFQNTTNTVTLSHAMLYTRIGISSGLSAKFVCKLIERSGVSDLTEIQLLALRNKRVDILNFLPLSSNLVTKLVQKKDISSLNILRKILTSDKQQLEGAVTSSGCTKQIGLVVW
jgi:hypothetical protein